MNNKQLADSLKDLVKLYSDSAWNYERALDQIQDEDMKQQLAEMRGARRSRRCSGNRRAAP